MTLQPRCWALDQDPPPWPADGGWLAAQDPALLLIDLRLVPAPLRRAELVESLSSSERERLTAYTYPADQERFLLGRAGLRQLLGLWLNQPPATVRLETGPHGKPFCPAGLEFNISHSGDLILLAFHRQQPVGVDVERLQPQLDWKAIARLMLGASQTAAILELPPADQHQAFLQMWCQMEAELKAGGWGLIDRPAPPPRENIRHWNLKLPAGYVGAAALLNPSAKAAERLARSSP